MLNLVLRTFTGENNSNVMQQLGASVFHTVVL